MKLIFLDVDGVLNNPALWERTNEARKRYFLEKEHEANNDGYYLLQLCPILIGNLNKIIVATAAKVVLSSSWRHTCPPKKMQSLLNHHGFCGEIIGATPTFSEIPEGYPWERRGGEIHRWMELYLPKMPPEDPIVIIDDDSDMEPWMERLVRTNGPEALSEERAEAAIKMLQATPMTNEYLGLL